MQTQLAENLKSAAAVSQEPFVAALLRDLLSRKLQKNPQFSLRAFARSLDVSHTLLSLVLSGKRKPSRDLTLKIIAKLNLTENSKNMVMESLDAQEVAQVAQEKNKHQISLDQFSLISEWQHYAILSLLEVPNAKLDPIWIGKRLGISSLLARVAIERLQRMEIIEEVSKGVWKQKIGPIVVENKVSTSSTRKFQRQLMKKAVDSLENDPIELRDFSNITFAMNPKHIPYALQKIREFRRKLCNELEVFGDQTEVYNLSVQIFPLSQKEKK